MECDAHLNNSPPAVEEVGANYLHGYLYNDSVLPLYQYPSYPTLTHLTSSLLTLLTLLTSIADRHNAASEFSYTKDDCM